MNKGIFLVAVLMCNIVCYGQIKKFTLAIHGGAGTIKYDSTQPEKQLKYERALDSALQIGYKILANNGSSLDAVEAVVRYMEDNPLFNAGKGAVFTNAGKNELDASIMDGKNLAAGAIAGVTTIKNPITTARAVMEKSAHVMLIGQGAEQFAKEQGHVLVNNKYFFTSERWEGLMKMKKMEAEKKAQKDATKTTSLENINITKTQVTGKYGTVGAVALDMSGNIAAATSTGGMTNKRYGRVGDVPIIGAGTYANNATCGISCTGWGEFFIRLVMAKSISDMMEYKQTSINEAARVMVQEKLPALGGDGGLVGVDRNGNVTMQFNSTGMYRGFIKSNGEKFVGIFK